MGAAEREVDRVREPLTLASTRGLAKLANFANSLTEQLNQHLPREVHVPGPDLLGDRAGRPASRSRFAGNNAIRILGR